MAALELKQAVISGTVSFAAGDTEKTVPISITQPTKTIYRFDYSLSGEPFPDDGLILAKLTGSPGNYNLIFRRTASGVTAEVSYQIFEFASGLTVQHILEDDDNFTGTGGSMLTKNVTISSVTPGQTLVLKSNIGYSGSWDFDESFKTKITSSTNLALYVWGDMSPVTPVEFFSIQVIEFDADAASVAYYEPALSSTFINQTITSVDTSKTWVFHDFYRDNDWLELDLEDYATRARLTSATNVQIDRFGSTDILYCGLYVVEFADVSVFRGSGTFSTGTANYTLPVTVDTESTWLNIQGLNNGCIRDSSANDRMDRCLAKTTFTSTTLTLSRGGNINGGPFEYQGASFPIASSKLLSPSGGVGIGSPMIF